MREVLIVDGYNIIGAWPELVTCKRESLETARERLIEMLKEYQSFTGQEIIVVFDAHSAEVGTRKQKFAGIRVVFSKENETADEVIERLAYEMQKTRVRVYVATSDYVEQQVTFGDGALRISANELLTLYGQALKSIRRQVERLDSKRNTIGDSLDEKIAKIFENWRRK